MRIKSVCTLRQPWKTDWLHLIGWEAPRFPTWLTRWLVCLILQKYLMFRFYLWRFLETNTRLHPDWFLSVYVASLLWTWSTVTFHYYIIFVLQNAIKVNLFIVFSATSNPTTETDLLSVYSCTRMPSEWSWEMCFQIFRGLVVFGAGLIDLIDTTTRSEKKEGQTATNRNPCEYVHMRGNQYPTKKHKLHYHCFVKRKKTNKKQQLTSLQDHFFHIPIQLLDQK